MPTNFAMTGFARRSVLAGLLAAGSTAALPRPRATPPRPAAMTVYRDAGCGCCEAWADRARDAGYKVAVTNVADMAAIKRRFGVPAKLLSCHTAIVGGYAIEGHVPLEAVARLLKYRPRAIRGIAVAGMPRGTPGMEVPGGSVDPFQVMAFDAAGRTSVFRS